MSHNPIHIFLIDASFVVETLLSNIPIPAFVHSPSKVFIVILPDLSDAGMDRSAPVDNTNHPRILTPTTNKSHHATDASR